MPERARNAVRSRLIFLSAALLVVTVVFWWLQPDRVLECLSYVNHSGDGWSLTYCYGQIGIVHNSGTVQWIPERSGGWIFEIPSGWSMRSWGLVGSHSLSGVFRPSTKFLGFGWRRYDQVVWPYSENATAPPVIFAGFPLSGTTATFRYREIDVPIWLFIIAFSVAPSIRVYRFVRELRQPKPNECVECGYDLTGNVSGKCPECGQPAITLESRST
jgi:hypothetical protein